MIRQPESRGLMCTKSWAGGGDRGELKVSGIHIPELIIYFYPVTEGGRGSLFDGNRTIYT